MNKCVHSCIIIFFAFSRVERNGVSITSQQTLSCKNTIDPQILFPSLIGYGIIISSVVLHVKYKTTSTETQQQYIKQVNKQARYKSQPRVGPIAAREYSHSGDQSKTWQDLYKR